MADLFHELAGTFLMLENKQDNLTELWNMNYELFFLPQSQLKRAHHVRVKSIFSFIIY